MGIIEKLGITKGPWKFDVRPRSKNCFLKNGKSDIVMDFRRWGMHGAQPFFAKDGLIHPVETFSKIIEGREHHQWINEIDHPDAKVIESAAEMLESWILTALRIEAYYLGNATKNQLLDSIYIDAVKNACNATGKTWDQIKELL